MIVPDRPLTALTMIDYTVNVLARDTAGNVSWSSPPLTFVGGIDITNTGTSTLDGWTLTFTWPTPWQQVTSGWNGNWTQDRTIVTVTKPDASGGLAAGATANLGFVGAYNGPNVPPTVFTLNGTVCTTR